MQGGKRSSLANKPSNTTATGGGGRGIGRSGRGRGGARRKSGGKGRGGRQHAGNNDDPKNNSSLPTMVNIQTTNFVTSYHAEKCLAARYKVHAPLCSCPKVVKLRQRHAAASSVGAVVKSKAAGGQDGEEASNEICNTAIEKGGSSAANDNAGYSGNEVQFDIDGTISHKLSSLNLESKGADDNGSDPFDNLLVLPDTKGTNPTVYICNGTNKESFQRDGTACERKLAREIFGPHEHNNNVRGETDTANESDTFQPQDKVLGFDYLISEGKDIPPFKVNCAICLLTTHQRNGFVAIASQTLEEIQPTMQCARDVMSHKLNQHGGGEGKGALHADHAHFVCTLELSTLQSLLSSGKTRSMNTHLNMEILSQMRESGVDCLPAEMTEGNKGTPSNDAPTPQIKMGHHLTSLLYLLEEGTTKAKSTKSKSPAATKPTSQPNSVTNPARYPYMMVMGYIDTPNKLTLDLPGGKRHLGESTLHGVIREVEEECSLLLNHEWLVARVSKRYGGNDDCSGRNIDDDDRDGIVQVLEPRKIKGSESGDAFFVMTPPPMASTITSV